MILEAKIINSNYDLDDVFPVLKKFQRSLNENKILNESNMFNKSDFEK